MLVGRPTRAPLSGLDLLAPCLEGLCFEVLVDVPYVYTLTFMLRGRQSLHVQ
jgi:hypothetical protein